MHRPDSPKEVAELEVQSFQLESKELPKTKGKGPVEFVMLMENRLEPSRVKDTVGILAEPDFRFKSMTESPEELVVCRPSESSDILDLRPVWTCRGPISIEELALASTEFT